MTIIDTWKEGSTRLSRVKGAGEFIPTWQEGQAQPNPNPLLSFATDGYSKNSLIYSCIRQKASSFASLRPLIVRKDESVVKRHRLLDLMASPNTFQDYEEFADLLETQFEAAGNVYIQKVRVSADANRREKFAGYPVQELQLIRPDYVTIAPGPTRDRDVFEVTIGGQVRSRIPRRDMIHIHEPNLINDFYGLSKIALLTREGAIDLEMSDFELSFFRNAGVPMGLLNVKGRLTKEQAIEVKGNFRKAYNGIRHWFDLLVLNQDEATFTQLGMAQKDMEMDSTRFHVETRTCAVFGIPPVLVGARVAMQGGATTFTYEDAQHAFWAETMVPTARRIAGAFTAHLLPEFALIADDGAVFSYDFTQVRALQEDRSRKLREVTRLVNAGWVVNDALTVNGMATLPDGEIRILTGNQVIVDRAGNVVFQLQSGSQSPNPDNPLVGAAQIAEEYLTRKVGA